MKNPFSRALGYLAEGFTGLCGLEGAKVAAPSVAHSLIFQAPVSSLTIEQLQGMVTILMQVVVGVVTVWRMIRPKKTMLVEPPPAPPVLVDLPAAPPPVSPFVPSQNPQQ